MSLEIKNLHVYKSSAGSGKTTTLSIEYLKLALTHKDSFKHILALTFTNKAAQEMKDRILDYLQELVQFKDAAPPFFLNDLINDISKYKSLKENFSIHEAYKVVRQDSYSLYRRILHQYSEYAVTTLDSFTNRLIRSFSHDLGLSFNYQVELDTQQLLKDAVEELVNRIGIHEDLLTRVLTRYSQQKIDSETSRRINRDLEAQAKSLLNDVEEKYLKPLRLLNLEDILSVQKRINIEIASIEKELQCFGESFIAICSNNGIIAKMFFQGGKSIYPYFEKFRLKNFKDILPNNFVKKIIETGEWTSKTAPKENKQLIESVSESLLSIYSETQNYIEREYSNYLLMLQMKKSIFPYMVLMELEKILSQIKIENQVVHISDFNKIISDEIAQESAPYIYERIGNRYQHYLLDEFQDTSVIQWHNLLPLIENSLSENHFNLIVGDSKQAIYRWRGSEIEQFSNLPELLNKDESLLMLQRENMLKNAYFEVQLNTNYRSKDNIISFNNLLFTYMLEQQYIPDDLKNIYKDHIQKVDERKEKGGAVEVHFLELPPKSNKDAFVEAYHQKTMEAINSSIEQGFDFKDIAILTRGNKDLILLAKFLLENGIPIISSESLNVSSSPQVQFIISLIKHLEQPLELVYQSEILRYLLEFGQLKDKGLEEFSKHIIELDYKDELNKYWKVLNIKIDKAYLATLEAYEAIEALVRLFSMDSSEPLLHFFIEASYIFSQDKHQGLRDFLEWWEIKQDEFTLEVPEDWNAVKLMTFHKAKGLQFPIVINWFSHKLATNKTGQSNVWIDPQLEKFPEIQSFPFTISSLENTVHQPIYDQEINLSILDDANLFYVANTRPTEKLILFLDKETKKKTSNTFLYSQLMQSFVESDLIKKIDDNIYLMGDEIKKVSKESSDEENIKVLEVVQNDDWRKLMKLAVEKEQHSVWNDSAAWGQKVHAVLAEINHEEDLKAAFNSLVYRGVIDQDEQAIIEELVLQVIQHPSLSIFYSQEAKVYNEREIIEANGSIYRPDRMVLINDEFIIIDYKTGQPSKKDHEQVHNYIKLVTTILDSKVKGFLVYLHEEIHVEELN